MEVSFELHKIIEFTIYDTVVFFLTSGTSADISGIVNEFVQYVQNYFQYVYIPI